MKRKFNQSFLGWSGYIQGLYPYSLTIEWLVQDVLIEMEAAYDVGLADGGDIAIRLI